MIHYAIFPRKPKLTLTFSCNNEDKLPMKWFQLRASHQLTKKMAFMPVDNSLNKTLFSDDLILCAHEKSRQERKKIIYSMSLVVIKLKTRTWLLPWDMTKEAKRAYAWRKKREKEKNRSHSEFRSRQPTLLYRRPGQLEYLPNLL